MDTLKWCTQVLGRSDEPIDQHQARRGCGCIGQGKRLHNDGGKVGLAVLACLWHLDLPYSSHDLPQVTGFEIQGEKERYCILISSVLRMKTKKLSE